MRDYKRFLLFQLPAIIWAIIIYIQSSIPDLNPPSLGISFQDKILHTIVFGILGYLIFRALYFSKNENLKSRAIVIGLIVGFLYAISDEVHQAFVPGRYSEIGDVIADFLGILLAQIPFKYRINRLDRRDVKRRSPEN